MQHARADQRRVIRSKLVPPALPDRHVARPRLERVIARLMERRRVIVVSATAGAGKTTAVCAAIGRSKRPVAWLTLDRSDRAPGRLLMYLEEALGRRRPAAVGAATGALAAGIGHTEAAGLLAEAAGSGEERLVLVLDELERLGDDAAAWAVVEALLRYAPAGTCLILISRRDIPTALCALPSPAATAVLGDGELAFTVEEAALVLSRNGGRAVDPRDAVDQTSGWVTGVLFSGWRGEPHFAGQGGETDPLYDYLSSQILGQLDEPEREFLIGCSLLDEITVPRAQALGYADAGARLAALRPVHLPATWGGAGRIMRCHSYFREYLRARLERRGEDEVTRLRIALGRRLADEGHDEEAVEELLRAGAREEAVASVERAIAAVVERLDLAVAERWLSAIPAQARRSAAVVTAELLLAIARDQIARGVEIADRLAASGDRDRLVRDSDRAGLLIVWCYLHVGRVDDIDAVLAAVRPGPDREAMRYARDALFGDGAGGAPVGPDPAPSGPIGAIVCNADYALGRLPGLSEGAASGWVQAIERPWRTAALRARGLTGEAVLLLEEARGRGVATPTMLIFAGPEVLLDARRIDEAYELLGEARAVAEQSGSLAYQGYCGLLAAKLALRAHRDTDAARAALAEPVCQAAAAAVPFMGELAEMWAGFAALLDGDHRTARVRLTRAVDGMAAADRMLELPTAAVYLAEACWRAGDERAADAAAAASLEAARRQGSNHILLQALADVPALVARCVEAEAADSVWHQLGRALAAQGAQPAAAPRAAIELAEFGRRGIVVAGDEVRPRIAKSYELLAYLAATDDGRADREELLEALFGERRDDSTRAYLRQAVHQLREVLPDGTVLAENGHVRLADDVGVGSESVSLQRRLVEAARLQGDDRLAATLAAVAIYDRGEYLPGPRGGWADGRQQQLSELVGEARYQAAVLAFGAGRYEQAGQLTGAVLSADPLREAAWRLAMRIASALGDEDGVLRGYQGCEAALGELGASPSASTRQLLGRLRG